MKTLYVNQDTVSGLFTEPYTAHTDEEVKRSLQHLVPSLNDSLKLAQFSDTAVYAVGFVDDSGEAYRISPFDIPRFVCRGADFLSPSGGDNNA